MDGSTSRASIISSLEREAELLVAHQLDLLAQIEAQLRSVHHAMRRIERMRGAQKRVGAELSNGERRTMLVGLSAEIAELDKHLAEEHEGCALMQTTIRRMQMRVATLRHAALRIDTSPEPEDGGSVDTR